MTTQHDKAKRWRPRFSVRTLVIIVTLLCAFLASLDWLSARAIRDVRHFQDDEMMEEMWQSGPPGVDVVQYRGVPRSWNCMYTARTPFLIVVDEHRRQAGIVRRHYFWFFGARGRLPVAESATPMTIDVWQRKRSKAIRDYLED